MLQSPPGATPASAPAMDKSSPCGPGAPGSSAGSKGQQPRSASAGPAAGESKPKGGKSREGVSGRWRRPGGAPGGGSGAGELGREDRGNREAGGLVLGWLCGGAELLVGLFVWILAVFGSGHYLFLLSFSFLFRLRSLFAELWLLLSSSSKD